MRRVLWSAALASIALSAGLVLAGDQETSQQIADSLSSRLKNYSVGVKVEDGTVWLNGFVANQKQMAMAIQTAQRCPGVERVVNNLAIGSVAPASTGSVHNTATSGGNTQLANNKFNDDAARPQIPQANMDMPEQARQQLALAGSNANLEGPASASVNGQSAQARPSNAQTSFANAQTSFANAQGSFANAQGAPGYFPGNGGYPMNTGYYASAPGASGNTNAAYYAPAPGGMAPAANGMRPMAPPQGPLPLAAANPTFRPAAMQGNPGNMGESIGAPQPMQPAAPMGAGAPAPYHFDHPQMPGYAWPSYAAYPNYGAVTYPKQYSPTAWPYIGPFYPYPQVPLGWRKVSLEWEDGWWFLDFKDSHNSK
ncbi:MAG TPA: BON domain-containing protein [Pirellulales bacterium]|jgi:hypothetical protein|nr:BON domain-containing protein [Pirellulales bacterium]